MASSTIKMLVDLSKLLNIGGNVGVSDLDNAPANSITWANGEFAHTPDGGTRFAGHIITINTLSTHRIQFAIRYSGADAYIRACVDNTWQRWYKITQS